jgi:hypothetical protein
MSDVVRGLKSDGCRAPELKIKTLLKYDEISLLQYRILFADRFLAGTADLKAAVRLQYSGRWGVGGAIGERVQSGKKKP